MVKSMTGYGTGKGTSGDLDITVEMKSYNNRYLDCSVRIPRIYSFAEDPVKAIVQSGISRGKVEVYVNIDSSRADNITITLNEPLIGAYINAFKEIEEKFGILNDVTTMSLCRFPEVLRQVKEEADQDAVTADICAAVESALADFNEMRTREGAKLYADITGRLETIESLISQVEARSPETVAEYRSKLEQRMREVLASTAIDESRILTEAAIFADKVAVAEETVRLRSHIDQCRKLLDSSASVGRKLDFLIQEFNREANTIGSKCTDIEISRVVVDMKAEIEKIREQIQNIE